VCLYACYLRGGIERFRQASVAEYLQELESLRADGIAVGKHGDYRLATFGRGFEGFRRLGSGRIAGAVERIAVHIVRDEPVARPGEIARHGMAHPAEADETDARGRNDNA